MIEICEFTNNDYIKFREHIEYFKRRFELERNNLSLSSFEFYKTLINEREIMLLNNKYSFILVYRNEKGRIDYKSFLVDDKNNVISGLDRNDRLLSCDLDDGKFFIKKDDSYYIKSLQCMHADPLKQTNEIVYTQVNEDNTFRILMFYKCQKLENDTIDSNDLKEPHKIVIDAATDIGKYLEYTYTRNDSIENDGAIKYILQGGYCGGYGFSSPTYKSIMRNKDLMNYLKSFGVIEDYAGITLSPFGREYILDYLLDIIKSLKGDVVVPIELINYYNGDCAEINIYQQIVDLVVEYKKSSVGQSFRLKKGDSDGSNC